MLCRSSEIEKVRGDSDELATTLDETKEKLRLQTEQCADEERSARVLDEKLQAKTEELAEVVKKCDELENEVRATRRVGECFLALINAASGFATSSLRVHRCQALKVSSCQGLNCQGDGISRMYATRLTRLTLYVLKSFLRVYRTNKTGGLKFSCIHGAGGPFLRKGNV